MALRRGDLVTIAAPGDYGKPRPALIVQADAFGMHSSVTVLPLTSELHDAPLLRIKLSADAHTGLRVVSQVMVDKAVTLPQAKLGNRIGCVDADTLAEVSRALAKFLGLDR